MAIDSTSFVDGKISKVHACNKMGGKNQSPPLSISGLPSGATHIAVIMDDPDAKSVAGKTWVHWNVFNIKAEGDGYSIDAAKKPNGLIGKTRVVAVVVGCVRQTAPHVTLASCAIGQRASILCFGSIVISFL